MLGAEVLEVELLELANLVGLNLVEVATDTGVEDANLLLRGHRDVLLLLEELSELLTTVEQLLGSGIEIRAELSEGSDLTVLGELELHGAGNLLHGLDLGGGADTGHGKTNINGRADTLVEQISLQEDLAVRNRDDVGRDVSGKITGLGLNDGKGSKRASTEGVVQLSRTLEKTRMEVEDITGVGLTTRRASEQQRHLAVGNSLLGEIVVDDESVLAVVTEELTNGAAGVRGQELERSGLGGSSSDDDGIIHGLLLLENTHDVGNSGALLADSGVDAVELLGGVALVEVLLLVDDRVNGNGGLASLTIANDQLTLASANRHKSIDALEAGLHGLVDRLTRDNARSLELNTRALVALDGTEAIDGVAERVNNTAEHAIADRDIDNGTGSLDDIAFLDLSIVTKDDDSDVVRLEVQGHTLDTRGELNHLTGLNLHQTEHTGNTITNRDDSTELLKVRLNTR